jgi:hypothetical protein
VTPLAQLDVQRFPSAREEAWRYTPVDEIVARLEAATASAPMPMSTPATAAA